MSRLIVKNLPSGITEKKLKSVFEEKGFVTDVQLKYKNGIFRKFAFIGYKTEEEAKAAKKYFNNTFIHTSKIQVETCKNLCDPNKPKSWKEIIEHAKAKRAEKLAKEKEKAMSKSSKQKTVIPDELKDNAEFKEFLAVHTKKGSRPLWADILDIPDDKAVEFSDDGCETALKDGTDGETRKMTNSAEEMSLKKTEKTLDKEKFEKKKKVHNDAFTVKLRNLPQSCKKSHIKKFLKPAKISSLRKPPKFKGFAYVSFNAEKDYNIALLKHGGILEGCQISVFKYTKREENSKKQPKQTEEEKEKDLEMLAETGRIYARNLCYSVSESDLEEVFSKYGPLADVNLPVDLLTKRKLGYAFISFVFAEHAVKAFSELDGTIFQGRVLHLIPSKPKPEVVIDENETNYKKKKTEKIKSLSGSAHNWNILFLGKNAVADVIAQKYKVEKAQLLSGDSKESVAVRMALAETQLVLETRKFLIDNGVQLDSFNQPASERSKTVIIVKHLPANTTAQEINELFAKHGVLSRVIVPPSGLVALVEFQDPTEARGAFRKLAYTCFKKLPLYLEWAPVDPIKEPPPKVEEDNTDEKMKETQNDDEIGDVAEHLPGTTIFVKNINFATTEENFRKHFEKCGRIIYAKISTKKDIKTGKTLSMGFGFVQFKKESSATFAVQNMQMSKLDGYCLEIKFSNPATVPSGISHRKKNQASKQLSAKILVKNIPFKTSQREIKDLFKEFGALKSVRLPMKFGSSEHRGFGFVEFVSKSDAKRAFEALCHSTHIYDRRLILEWAKPDSEDVEELRKKTARDFAISGGRVAKVRKTKFEEDVAMAQLKDQED